eukprot:TRINITY_DN19718_c0_g1_i1.p1 TRINITY_DN19718_c0_g1~~TRINITY_DN19718_c0_g1_i1.p1  ORF type:complete len:400 (-),score=179.51 TRINITY_DN19718_c0_g1_i1:98-1297(-)
MSNRGRSGKGNQGRNNNQKQQQAAAPAQKQNEVASPPQAENNNTTQNQTPSDNNNASTNASSNQNTNQSNANNNSNANTNQSNAKASSNSNDNKKNNNNQSQSNDNQNQSQSQPKNAQKSNQGNNNNNNSQNASKKNNTKSQNKSQASKKSQNNASSNNNNNNNDSANSSDDAPNSNYAERVATEGEWVAVGKSRGNDIQRRLAEAQNQVDNYNRLISDQQSKIEEFNTKIAELTNSDDSTAADLRRQVEELEAKLSAQGGPSANVNSSDSLFSRNYTTGDRSVRANPTLPVKLRNRMDKVESIKYRLGDNSSSIERIHNELSNIKNLDEILARTDDYSDEASASSEGGVGAVGGEAETEGKGKEKVGEEVVSGGVGDGVREADGENAVATAEQSVPGQ